MVPGALISASYVSDVYNVLTGNTVENIAFSGSVNITGSLIADLTGTAETASYVTLAQTASYVSNAVSSSYAVSASYATTASYSIVTTNVVTSSSFADSATSASYAVTASYITNSIVSTTVTVTANDFINASSIVIKELISSPGLGKYIKLVSLVGKFKNATVAYDQAPSVSVVSPNGTIASVIPLTSLGTTEKIVSYTSNGIANVNENIYLQYKVFSGLPTTGDGDIIFEIEYEILDF